MDDYVLVPGQAGMSPWELTDAELVELEARLRRKRPCGFAPWPEDREANEDVRARGSARPVRARNKKPDASKPRARRRQ